MHKICVNCNNRFIPTREDQMFCGKRCRLNYYKKTSLSLRKIKCKECPRHRKGCELWMGFKGKTHPHNCPEAKYWKGKEKC